MFPFPPLGDAYYEIQLEQASARLCRVRRTAHAGRGCRDLRVLLINTMSSVRAHLLNIGRLPMRAILPVRQYLRVGFAGLQRRCM